MTGSHRGDGEAARFDYTGLDRVIHEKARLGIMTSLSSRADGLAFSDLRTLVGLTDGNLSRHLQTLEDAKLVEIQKGFRGKRPHTNVVLTDLGRERFVAYVSELQRVVKDAARASKSNKRSGATARTNSRTPKPA